jgi:hypothetical protein
MITLNLQLLFCKLQNSQFGITMEALHTNHKDQILIHFYIQWRFSMTRSGWHPTNLLCAKRTNMIILPLVKHY